MGKKLQFGEKLRRARKRTSLSQSEAAKMCGVKLASLQNWEQGRYEPVPMIRKIMLETLKEYKKK